MSPLLIYTLYLIVFQLAQVQCKQSSWPFVDDFRSQWPSSSGNKWPLTSHFVSNHGRQQEYKKQTNRNQEQDELGLGDELNDDYYYQPSERYDDQHHQHHKELEHHQEGKEVSFVYPVVLALLILGALFIPFISLFFFLAVSAFNCQTGGAGGFAQVTPLFGRRRRKRRSLGLDQSPSSSSSGNKTYSITTASLSFEPKENNSTWLQDRKHQHQLAGYDDEDDDDHNYNGQQWNLNENYLSKQLRRNSIQLLNSLAKFEFL